ncbi:hypothetical protein [Pelagibaculum spongiae]|nr:hypothetical protein [Pelagibaculum spongiae]
MNNLLKIILLCTLPIHVSALEANIAYVFGVSIGKPLSKDYIPNTANSYPTRLITLPVPQSYELDVFESINVQIIEKSKRVYSISAEIEMTEGGECNDLFKRMLSQLDKKYKHLKKTSEINVGDKVIPIFDGYLSSGKKIKMDVYCSRKESSPIETFGISVSDRELSEEANKLWQ